MANENLYSQHSFVCFQEIERMLWHTQLPSDSLRHLLSLYLPVMILGTILNALLLITILSSKRLRNDPRNSFILALAVSDFFLCNFTSPLTLWSTLAGHWPFAISGTEILCRILKAGQDFPIVMSSFCIGAIACDRFRYIVTPEKNQMTAKQVRASIIAFWWRHNDESESVTRIHIMSISQAKSHYVLNINKPFARKWMDAIVLFINGVFT